MNDHEKFIDEQMANNASYAEQELRRSRACLSSVLKYDDDKTLG